MTATVRLKMMGTGEPLTSEEGVTVVVMKGKGVGAISHVRLLQWNCTGSIQSDGFFELRTLSPWM